MKMDASKLSQLYQQACLQELQALKPGNVHIFADGHDMQVLDFIQSAEVSALPITSNNASVGERIYNATKATKDKVGMNTNLGILLLCAPLLQAYSAIASNEVNIDHLKQALVIELNNLTVEDAQHVAKAIVLANPAGLKTSEAHDVNQTPAVTLYTMMHYAQDVDRIAWQYANAYADIFDHGLHFYAEGLEWWGNDMWATTWLYINYLSTILDTHVIRKYGHDVATILQEEAIAMKVKIEEVGHPKLVMKALMAWDASLKDRKLNPGTSADLTVATIVLSKLSGCKLL
jgi:triphosphoribosyl-dephospho-CoA synthase